ncbi:uncharacterized protein LOC127382643 [Apus apus]|uniref:uncharacterized protein LOC127382643 n=1 Tax=Apus apus TaxID=8895 RepID=UPI0021F87C7B|nr:uncharacterized protein LOC127382643 [Apus apus]XP_051470507.1 uncharacterized protein LOC127382643 [Apus apus]XP_051470518.1 uncharacterized protein LOC127382643 [Apus apus]XP_051470526.1 uncharacterized protein LOC127382643 [Apus apus]XP_051470535.1 uncharacterized protein LOC127382643 [Apus apus]XP_051470544.1 uncharacterized protein LOC127382643 [Apus apus]
MEPTFTAAALEVGPVYFFDQLKPTMKERVKKIPEEKSSYFTTNILLGFTPSLIEDRFGICTGERAETHEDGFLNNDTARKEKYPVWQQVPWHSMCKTTTEDSNPKFCRISLIPQADEDSPVKTLNKSVADNMLQELGETLQLLAKYETRFPRGLVDVVTCSWREFSEGVDGHKRHWQSLGYRSVTSRKSQASEEVKGSAPGSECRECETTALRKKLCKDNFALQACTTKEKRKPETASNLSVGGEAPVVENDADQSLNTISFSLSSNISEEGGWVFQLSGSNSEDMHQGLPYLWTLERLEQMQKQIEEQTSKLKEMRFDKPVILRHYGDPRDETSSKTWNVQTGMTVTPELTYGKPQIPVGKKAGTAKRKLHYVLNDGSSFI